MRGRAVPSPLTARKLITYDYVLTQAFVEAPMPGQNFSIRTDAAKLTEIDRLAQAQSRSRNFVVNEAIDRYLAEERRWAEKVQAGLAAAEAGDFASDAEVDALFQKFEADSKG